VAGRKLLSTAFRAASNGGLPNGGPLILDAAGNLYGTTQGFGAYGYGVVFELSPAGDGTWTEQPIYSFNGKDEGSSPYGLALDGSGLIYGVAIYAQTGYDGLLFELTQSGGVWNEQVLHRFSTTSGEGNNPEGVTVDAAGNLYVTTYFGGKYDYGTAIKLTPNGAGGWTEKDLHSFTGGPDGAYPASGLIVGVDGDLFGTTPFGGSTTGSAGCGVVYTLKP
jgi:uncharacterized repeat protein (TIGR03803 family)